MFTLFGITFGHFIAVLRSNFDGDCPYPAYKYSTTCCCGGACCWTQCDWSYGPSECLPDGGSNSKWIKVDNRGRYEAFYKFSAVRGNIL